MSKAPEHTTKPDPAFAAIAAHNAAYAAFNTVSREGMALEESLPSDRHRSNMHSGDIELVEGDAPEWIANLHSFHAASAALDEAAIGLLAAAANTTLPGVVALIRHAAQMAQLEPYPLWPTVQDDDVRGNDWSAHFHIALAASLAKAVQS